MNGEATLLLPREGTFGPIVTGRIQPCEDGDERLSSQRGELPQRLWDRDKPPVSEDQKTLVWEKSIKRGREWKLPEGWQGSDRKEPYRVIRSVGFIGGARGQA